MATFRTDLRAAIRTRVEGAWPEISEIFYPDQVNLLSFEVMADERLSPFRIDFREELAAGAAALLRGMVEEARSAQG